MPQDLKFDRWQAAERDVEQAEHSWLTAIYSIDADPKLVRERHAELVEARKAALILLAQSLNESAAAHGVGRTTAQDGDIEIGARREERAGTGAGEGTGLPRT
ncbi:hypothetical protein [Variovorax sp. KK3]|uniref:hypothetical protein n=1 Tax=Variovorax sp. KK3 TaxID=1855728 RepID=UPI00117F2DAE|nr:hypothetical protein [Variovorax sp. KK3]